MTVSLTQGNGASCASVRSGVRRWGLEGLDNDDGDGDNDAEAPGMGPCCSFRVLSEHEHSSNWHKVVFQTRLERAVSKQQREIDRELLKRRRWLKRQEQKIQEDYEAQLAKLKKQCEKQLQDKLARQLQRERRRQVLPLASKAEATPEAPKPNLAATKSTKQQEREAVKPVKPEPGKSSLSEPCTSTIEQPRQEQPQLKAPAFQVPSKPEQDRNGSAITEVQDQSKRPTSQSGIGLLGQAPATDFALGSTHQPLRLAPSVQSGTQPLVQIGVSGAAPVTNFPATVAPLFPSTGNVFGHNASASSSTIPSQQAPVPQLPFTATMQQAPAPMSQPPISSWLPTAIRSGDTRMETSNQSKPILPVASQPPAGMQERVQVVQTPPERADGLKVSLSAVEFEKLYADELEVAKNMARPYAESTACGKERRQVDKELKKHIVQLARTREQIRDKSRDITSQFSSISKEDARMYAYLSFVDKLLHKVSDNMMDSMVYPVAEVAVGVATRHPVVMNILLGRLHEVSILTVPKYYVRTQHVGARKYMEAMGYREKEDGARQETDDEFIKRQHGYLMLYAAITQATPRGQPMSAASSAENSCSNLLTPTVENKANPHGVDHAWKYLSRLLNTMPPTRITASALESFVKVAGFKLYQTYRGQFVKLLQYIDKYFLKRLESSGDSEARAVYNRLHNYLVRQKFTEEPEDHFIPERDKSRNEVT